MKALGMARLGFPVVMAIVGAILPADAEPGENLPDAPEVEAGPPRSKWSAFAYVGQFSNTRFNQIIRFDTDFRSSWVGVVGVTREYAEIGPVRMEWEAQLGQHWGQQSHQEVNGLTTMRWTRFPWDEFLPTSVGFGGGFSYAFERPPLEERPDRRAAHFLVYLLLDLEVTRPQQPDWSLFLRLHHRSGAYGAISDARGSNFVGLGLRGRF